MGFPLSVAFLEAGERVVALDVDECKVALLAAGDSGGRCGDDAVQSVAAPGA